MRGAVGLVAIVTVVMCQPHISGACSLARCGAGYFVPASGSTVPANVPGIYWRSQLSFDPQAPARDPALVTLATTADPSTPVAVTTMLVRSSAYQDDYLIVPTQPLVPNSGYTVSDGNICSPSLPAGPTSTFGVGPAAPLPADLGVMKLASNQLEVFEVWTVSGSCTAPVDAASARIELELSAGAEPWRDVLHFVTVVDGQAWTTGPFATSYGRPGSNGLGRGVDRVFHVCHSDDPGVEMGVGPGAHVVEMRATLPGTNVVLATPPVSITLDCPPPPIEADVTDTTPLAPAGSGCATSDRPASATLFLALAMFARLVRRHRRR